MVAAILMTGAFALTNDAYEEEMTVTAGDHDAIAKGYPLMLREAPDNMRSTVSVLTAGAAGMWYLMYEIGNSGNWNIIGANGAEAKVNVTNGASLKMKVVSPAGQMFTWGERDDVADGIITLVPTGDVIVPAVFFDVHVELEPFDPVYTGKEIRPVPIVKFDGTPVTDEGVYAVIYTNNVNAGANTASVTVRGVGTYSGEVSVNFSIEKAPGRGSVSVGDWTYGTSPAVPKVVNTNGVTYVVEYRGMSGGWMPWDTITKELPTGEYEIRVTFNETDNHTEHRSHGMFTVHRSILEKPTAPKTVYGYNGSVITLDLEGFDASVMKVTGDKGKDVR